MKAKIIELLRSTERPGIENLINYMENESDFFKAPCSSQYHGCKEGGLAEHSMNVCEFALGMIGTSLYIDNLINQVEIGTYQDDKGHLFKNNIHYISLKKSNYNYLKFNNDDSSVIIVSLLHDLGKSTYRGKSNYVPNILTGGKVSEKKPFEVNKDSYFNHELKSILIAKQFIELTEDEEFAIYYHNGLYELSGREIQGKERPLQLLLHFADMWCSRFVEKENQVNE